jgi:hypothetical protein
MRTHHITFVIALAVTALAGARIARAQPAGAQAEVLFKQGIALMDAGNFGEACSAFDASDKLEPALSTLLNRADCREKNNQLASAWGLFLDAERQTRAATDAPTQQLHMVAIDHAAKLEPRLSKLTVDVPVGVKLDGLVVRRGADLVDPGAWNHPLPIDGGKYTISAAAPGHDTWTTVIEVAPEGDAKTVDVVALERSPIVIPPHRAKLPFILGGGAVVLIGTGLVFELSAESTYNQSKTEPDDAKQTSLWQSANHKRYAAEGIAGAGLALAGIAVWRYLQHGTVESETQQMQISVVPTVSASGDRVGVTIGGEF